MFRAGNCSEFPQILRFFNVPVNYFKQLNSIGFLFLGTWD
jgi:hypothetical protein